MANQANIMNMLQSNVADIGPFAHDNRFTVFFDSPSGAEYNSATKTTQEQYTRGRWEASATGFMPGCATAVQALRNTSWSHLPLYLGRVQNSYTRPTSSRVRQQPEGSNLNPMKKKLCPWSGPRLVFLRQVPMPACWLDNTTFIWYSNLACPKPIGTCCRISRSKLRCHSSLTIS